MKNILGYTILVLTFFGILMFGGCIVTGALPAPLAAGLALGYAIGGLGGMWLSWRKPKVTGFSPVYYDKEMVRKLLINTPPVLLQEVLPLPVAEGKTIQIFHTEGDDETRQV